MAVNPDFAKAVLNPVKLRDYCLSLDHPRGKHKARVLSAALGIGAGDAEWLAREILRLVIAGRPEQLSSDDFGTRWRVEFPVERQGRKIVLRTAWLTTPENEQPHFLSCWVK